MFRELEPDEKEVVRKWFRRNKAQTPSNEEWLQTLKIDVKVDDNFTTVLLASQMTEQTIALYVGVAKRSPRDPFNLMIGKAIAIFRAMKSTILFVKREELNA